MTKDKIALVRGFRDLTNNEGDKYNHIVSVCKQVGYSMGFSYAHLPIVEYVELFKRGMEFSDLVTKEMFILEDHACCLRPEITASAVRALSHSGDNNIRMMYDGPCFRYERPQKGRYRQFFQFGCEFFGEKFSEFDMFVIIDRIMKQLGVKYKLIINDIGTVDERKAYEEVLRKYVIDHYSSYSVDSQRRCDSGRCLRILDSKLDVEINANAPRICDFISNKTYFLTLCDFLKTNHIDFKVDYNLVRGLDYYNGMVFEIISEDYKVDSQQTAIGGGGRYDDLPEILGAKQVAYGCGFAFGIDRLMECIEYKNENKYNIVILEEDFSPELLSKVYNEYTNVINLGINASPKKFHGTIDNVIYISKDNITVKTM
jgi:histidyl-tRNA synthetase